MPQILGEDLFAHGDYSVPGGGGYDSGDANSIIQEPTVIHPTDPAAIQVTTVGNPPNTITYLSNQYSTTPPLGWDAFRIYLSSSEEPTLAPLLAQLWTVGFVDPAKLAWIPGSDVFQTTTSDQDPQNSPVMALDAWHWIERIFKVDATTHTCFWRVDDQDMPSSAKTGLTSTTVQYTQVGNFNSPGVGKIRYARHMWGIASSTSDWLGAPELLSQPRSFSNPTFGPF